MYDAIELTPGARTLVRILRRLGYRFALVSGGFSQITDRLAEDLGIHFSRANELEVVDGKLTGQIVGDVVDRAGKARALREFAAELGLDRGGGDRDRRRRQRPRHAERRGAGHRLQRQAGGAATRRTPSVNVPYLDTILYLLGISREEIEAADLEAGIVTPAPPV